MVEALVEYEYVAEQDDELSLKPGDIVTNVAKQDGGWWEGTLNGKRGVFPDNFVKEIKQTTKESKKAKGDGKGSNVHKLAENLQNQISMDVGGPPKRPGAGSTARKKLRAKVSYSYAPQNEDELELQIGEIVEIENKEEDGWWEGSVGGRRGVFPSNFVDLVDEDGAACAELTESQEEEVSLIKGKKPKGFGFGNIFADGGGASVLQKMKKKQSIDDVKFEPKPNTKKTVPETGSNAPSLPSRDTNKPETASNAPSLPSRDTNKPALPKQPPAPPPKVRSEASATASVDEVQVEKAKVLYPYTGENEDELSLEEGQVVTVLNKELEDGGWWKGEVNGLVGVFPDNFVELLQPEEKPKRPAPAAPAQSKTKPLPPQPEREETNKHAKENQKDTASKKAGPPLLTKKPTTKRADPKLIAQTDDHKVQEQKTGLYIDTAEPNPALKHPTKDRPKAPAKRPPTKSKESNAETEAAENGRVSPRDQAVVPKSGSLSPRNVNRDPPGNTHNQKLLQRVSGAEVAQLRQDLEHLRTSSVPLKQHQQLHTQVTHLQAQMEDMKKTLEKKIYNLVCEVDEEKKLRQNALVEMERVKKLLAPQ